MNDLLTFVVGPKDAQIAVRFEVITNASEGIRNVRPLDPLPPLNILGCRRLAKHLMALADLLEYSQPQYKA